MSHAAVFRSVAGGLLALAAISIPHSLAAQIADVRPAVDSAMGPLAWLIGEWQGEGAIQMPGGPQTARVHERVEGRLDGRVLVIEGVGREPAGDGDTGRVLHHALAVLTYDPDERRYVMRAFRDGRFVDADTELADGVFTWGFPVPGGRVRYHIGNDRGDWLETGEFSTDGAVWRPFFEMRLSRIPGSH